MTMKADEVKAARQRLRLMQKDLAAVCGLAPETLSRIEGGKAEMPFYAEMILMLIGRDEAALQAALRLAAGK